MYTASRFEATRGNKMYVELQGYIKDERTFAAGISSP